MREYLMSLIMAALIVGLIGALVPEGEGGGLRKYVTFAGCLCVLLLLISPITRVLGFVSELSDGDFDISLDKQEEIHIIAPEPSSEHLSGSQSGEVPKETSTAIA